MDASALRPCIAWVQCRQFDRNAWPRVNATSIRGAANGVDRGFVGVHIALGIALRQRRFAQHVVGEAKTCRFAHARIGERLGNGFAGDELLAHHAHCHVHALANEGLAPLGGQSRQQRGERFFAVRGYQLARQQQTPGGCVDKQRGALAQVRFPLAAADLVADQCVARRLVRNAQQGFGQAHQGHAFLR